MSSLRTLVARSRALGVHIQVLYPRSLTAPQGASLSQARDNPGRPWRTRVGTPAQTRSLGGWQLETDCDVALWRGAEGRGGRVGVTGAVTHAYTQTDTRQQHTSGRTRALLGTLLQSLVLVWRDVWGRLWFGSLPSPPTPLRRRWLARSVTSSRENRGEAMAAPPWPIAEHRDARTRPGTHWSRQRGPGLRGAPNSAS